MIDGIKLFVKNLDFLEWKQKTGIAFFTLTDLDNGNVKDKRLKGNHNIITICHKGNFETYILIVKETNFYKNGKLIYQTFNLTITGSLHKNFYNGKNYERFTYKKMQKEIKYLCNGLNLKPENCKIQNIEIGLNLIMNINVSAYIKNNLLLHSVLPFVEWDKDKYGLMLGRYAEYEQYTVKCYDKGLQNCLQYPLMRYELKYIKMQILIKYGIFTLADLMNFDKINKLLNLLLKSWDKVLIYEPDFKIEKLELMDKPEKIKILNEGKYRDFWGKLKETISKTEYYRQKNYFKKVIVENSTQKTHAYIRELIKNEWFEIVK